MGVNPCHHPRRDRCQSQAGSSDRPIVAAVGPSHPPQPSAATGSPVAVIHRTVRSGVKTDSTHRHSG